MVSADDRKLDYTQCYLLYGLLKIKLNRMELFQRILDKLQTPNNESLKMSMNHCHVRGMFSLVVDGDEFGKLTRIFIAENKLKPFEVQLHTHRYPIRLTTIKGDINHHNAVKDEKGLISMSEYAYKSFLNGGSGLEYVGETKVNCFDYKLPIGSTVTLGTEDYHTMSCSKGSIWIVEELGFETQESSVLGVPFVLDGLYSEPAMFQINDKCQVVIRELKKILENYRLA